MFFFCHGCLKPTILVKSHGTLDLFWQFHHSSPPPPPLPPYNVGSVCSKCPPWSNIVWGEGEGEGQVLEKEQLSSSNKGWWWKHTVANFQGVPHTFDQDCRLLAHCGCRSVWMNPYALWTIYVTRPQTLLNHCWVCCMFILNLCLSGTGYLFPSFFELDQVVFWTCPYQLQ